MILPVRTRLAIGAVVLALAGVATVVLLPRVERAVHQVEQMANSPHGLAGSAVQNLLNPHKRRPATSVAHHAGGSAQAGVPPHGVGGGSRPVGLGRAGAPARQSAGAHTPGGGGVPWWLVIGPVAAVLALVAASACSRIWFRFRRVYVGYPILVNGRDRVPADGLVGPFGAMGLAVAEPPGRRAWVGQPVFCLELSYNPRAGGQVMLRLLCEPRHVRELDAALRQAYPNAHVGLEFKRPYRAAAGGSWRPRCVWRLKKSRDPVYSMINQDKERTLTPPLERAAAMLHGLGEGGQTPAAGQFAAVRVIVWPSNRTASYLRERHRRIERRAQMAQRLAEGQRAPRSSVASQQAYQSVELGEHAMLHLEVQIAAGSNRACKALAGGLAPYPGMNTFKRRGVVLREPLYRRRWPAFAPPLSMRGDRKLFSASEVGYLLRLPSGDLPTPITQTREPRSPADPAEGREQERGVPLPGENSGSPGRPASATGGVPDKGGALPGATIEATGALAPQAGAPNGASADRAPADRGRRPVVVIERHRQDRAC